MSIIVCIIVHYVPLLILLRFQEYKQLHHYDHANDTYDDRTSRLRDEVCKENDQVNIKFLKQQEFNANIVKRLEELEDFKDQALVRLDQGIENRTKAFSRIEALEGFKYDTNIRLERIDDILVVHRNQSDTQRKNHANLIKVWDEKVIPLIKGTHGG